MGWIEDVGRAIGYMEENITRDLSVEDVLAADAWARERAHRLVHEERR